MPSAPHPSAPSHRMGATPGGARSGATDTLTTPSSRIDMTPRARSIATDATESAIGTRSAESAYARTRSPPTLAGRNVPTNVLTKKMRMTRRSDGRAVAGDGREQRQPSPRHQGAIEQRQPDCDQQGNRTRGRGDAPDLGGVADPEQPCQQHERDGDAHPSAAERRAHRVAGSVSRWRSVSRFTW